MANPSPDICCFALSENVNELKEIKPMTLFRGLLSEMDRFYLWRKRFREEHGRKRKRATNADVSQEEQDLQFLPGIPDDITVNVIVPKLPWTALQTLMCVSRVWKQAYESRQFYAARVQSFATEQVDVTQKHLPYFGNRLVVRSRRSSLPYVLPSIPRSENRRPAHYIIKSLDGKIYAVGGKHIQSLFVLDLAGQKQWKECTSMQEPREVTVGGIGKFQCNLKDGKLYVCGGVTYLEKAPWARKGRCEVYDPNVDSLCFTEFELTKWADETWMSLFLRFSISAG